MKGVALACASAIFIPVVGPIAAAIYAGGMIVAIPSIPIINTIRGIIKSRTKKYTDKIEYNRSKEVSNVNEQIESLLACHSQLNDKQFEDAYSKIIANITTLSSTTRLNVLNVVDSTANVDSNNVSFADKYVKEYKKVKSKLDFYQLKVNQYIAIGKPVPEKIQAEYDRLKWTFKNLNNNTVGNSYEEDSRMESLYFKAKSLKTFHKLKTLKDEKLNEMLAKMNLEASFDITRISYDAKKGLMLDGVSVMAREKDASKKFKKDEIAKEEWLSVREKIVASCKQEKIELQKPIYGDESIEVEIEDQLNEDLEVELNNDLTNENIDKNEVEVKPKKRRSTKKDIIIENSLVQQLEDRNSSIYEHVFKLLKKGKFKLSKEQAGVEIEKFIDKVNEAHNNKTSVKLMFEKGSIELYILTNGVKELKNLITMSYTLDKSV